MNTYDSKQYWTHTSPTHNTASDPAAAHVTHSTFCAEFWTKENTAPTLYPLSSLTGPRPLIASRPTPSFKH